MSLQVGDLDPIGANLFFGMIHDAQADLGLFEDVPERVSLGAVIVERAPVGSRAVHRPDRANIDDRWAFRVSDASSHGVVSWTTAGAKTITSPFDSRGVVGPSFMSWRRSITDWVMYL
ncbi:MAG: hypothetical protein QM736_07605 [Vicinamibacterales bacterium]